MATDDERILAAMAAEMGMSNPDLPLQLAKMTLNPSWAARQWDAMSPAQRKAAQMAAFVSIAAAAGVVSMLGREAESRMGAALWESIGNVVKRRRS